MAFFLLCLWALFLAVLACYVKQLVTDTRRHLPPGPWPLPIIGSILHMSKLPHRSLARLAERYGSPMTLRLGMSLFIVVSSPSTAREVLQTHNASLSGRNPANAWSAGGHGANAVFVLQPGRKWHTLRRLAVAQLFSPRRLDELQPLRQHVVSRLLGDVSEAASGGAPVSVRRAAFTAMARLLWRAMFSHELDEAASSQGLYDCVRGIMSLVMTPNVSDLFPAVAAADLRAYGAGCESDRLL
ncbi:cytochrome P450 76C1-like [Panicum virgatum]|uniref:Uncharacterized protein n=1 Tax=Panicum virgatum TaxID=38727 RepID=A0A8T0VSA7_PANVG|nr:cytochrome P450 76C1-like [Panicum virgatum]KAG2637878.1 hypothetical protein PVAP13_2NG551109 [Panicum virgatum]